MTITITKKDLKTAEEIARNTTPCTGSLKGHAGYCIIGCVIAGYAKNRHRGFYNAKNSIFGQFGQSGGAIVNALVGSGVPRHEAQALVGQNDQFKNMGLLKAWQVNKLKKLQKYVK